MKLKIFTIIFLLLNTNCFGQSIYQLDSILAYTQDSIEYLIVQDKFQLLKKYEYDKLNQINKTTEFDKFGNVVRYVKYDFKISKLNKSTTVYLSKDLIEYEYKRNRLNERSNSKLIDLDSLEITKYFKHTPYFIYHYFYFKGKLYFKDTVRNLNEIPVVKVKYDIDSSTFVLKSKTKNTISYKTFRAIDSLPFNDVIYYKSDGKYKRYHGHNFYYKDDKLSNITHYDQSNNVIDHEQFFYTNNNEYEIIKSICTLNNPLDTIIKTEYVFLDKKIVKFTQNKSVPYEKIEYTFDYLNNNIMIDLFYYDIRSNLIHKKSYLKFQKRHFEKFQFWNYN